MTDTATPSGDTTVDTAIPGATWTVDGVIHRRLNGGTHHGRIQKRNHQNKWVFVADPTKPPAPESAARAARKARAAAGKAKLPGGKQGRGVLPFADATPEEKLQIKLREKQRAIAKRSGVGGFELPHLPGVHVLSLAIRYLDGGRDRFVELVKLAAMNNEPAAVAWWTVYADLTPTERVLVSFDDVTMAAGIRPSDFVPLIVKTAMEIGRDVGNLVAAMTHPSIVAKAAASAERIDGAYADVAYRDRMALLQHHQFLPIPKGMSIHVNASANAQAAAAASAEPTVPNFADDVARTGQIRHGVQQQLQAPSAAEELFGTGAPATTPVAEGVLIAPDVDD